MLLVAVPKKRGAVFWKDDLSLSIKRKHVSLSTKIVTKRFVKIICGLARWLHV